jgi:hypothetical protein
VDRRSLEWSGDEYWWIRWREWSGVVWDEASQKEVRGRERETERDREKERKRERDSEGDRETETDERDERETERVRELVVVVLSSWLLFACPRCK